jgi:AraC-like DNA-binding protein
VEKLVEKILHSLTAQKENSKTDERIRVVEEIIATKLPGSVTIKYLANQVCISESRLRALFKQITGIPLYRYLLWSKIRFATNCLMAGYSVNEAAIEAGFADSSHFHKVMINMFGISPSHFINGNKKLKIIKNGINSLNLKTVVH